MKTKMTEEKLREAVAEAISIAGTLKKLEMSITTANYKSFHKKIIAYNIDTSHFRGQAHLTGKNHGSKNTIPFDQILINNSNYTCMAILKKRLVRNGLLKYKCYECGLSVWRGKKISLQLDHINGKHNDHRIENLRLLCPNCHSQTDTFCGKNIMKTDEAKQQKICKCGAIKRKESKTCGKCAAKNREIINWPTQEILSQMIESLGYSQVAKQLGVSHTTVKKRSVRLVDPATT